MTPQEILASYQQATGMKVSLSYAREQMLSDLASRNLEPPITGEEIIAVLKEIKRRVDIGMKGYTPASLEFRNAMVADTMEERILSLRQRTRRIVHKPQVPQTIDDGTSKITMLSDHVPEEPRRADAAQALRVMADQITKKAS